MTQMLSQRRNRESGPSLAISAAWLLGAVHEELYAELHEQGHPRLTHLHGAVLAFLDPAGTRATEIARRARRHKQVIGRVVDELESLGYVERRPDPSDRRAKFVVPTVRGLDAMRCSDEIVDRIERRVSRALGADAHRRFMGDLGATIGAIRRR